MQAVLFEIQLIRSNGSAKGPNAKEPGHERENDLQIAEPGNLSRRGSHGIKSILLKGEMRCVKDINMLVFLCSPL
jgi:guanylate cyclase, other